MNKSLIIVRLRCFKRYREGCVTRPDVEADTSRTTSRLIAIIPLENE